MQDHWISLPSKFRLEDVQAVLNVVVTAFSAIATFACVRYCWQRAAKRVAKDKEVPLYLLLSINTIGEALDLVLLLKQNLLDLRYFILCVQCFAVVCLTATTILSGPIVRYSSKVGTVVREEDVSGFLASRSHNGMGYANVEWNLTYVRLEKAGFPRDQLLDYLPDNSVDWNFKSEQWNNSWTLDCDETPLTAFELQASGNCTGLMWELPGLTQAFSYDQWDSYWQNWDGFYINYTTHKDILLFIYATKEWDYVETEDTYLASSIMLMSAHLHNVPRPGENASSDCEFGVGNIGGASYTKFECKVKRRNDILAYSNVAFPDVNTPGVLPKAYTEYYQARFTQQSTSDSVISTISPQELIRFYQVYMINKDIQYRQPITRRLNVEVKVVQISAAFLAITVLIVLLMLIGLALYGIFTLRFRRALSSIPQSKLDWTTQSIKEVENRTGHHTDNDVQRGITITPFRQSATTSTSLSPKDRFETATFGNRKSTVSTPGSPPPPFWSYANSMNTEKPKENLFCDYTPIQASPYIKSDLQPRSTVREITDAYTPRLQQLPK